MLQGLMGEREKIFSQSHEPKNIGAILSQKKGSVYINILAMSGSISGWRTLGGMAAFRVA